VPRLCSGIFSPEEDDSRAPGRTQRRESLQQPDLRPRITCPCVAVCARAILHTIARTDPVTDLHIQHRLGIRDNPPALAGRIYEQFLRQRDDNSVATFLMVFKSLENARPSRFPFSPRRTSPSDRDSLSRSDDLSVIQARNPRRRLMQSPPQK